MPVRRAGWRNDLARRRPARRIPHRGGIRHDNLHDSSGAQQSTPHASGPARASGGAGGAGHETPPASDSALPPRSAAPAAVPAQPPGTAAGIVAPPARSTTRSALRLGLSRGGSRPG